MNGGKMDKTQKIFEIASLLRVIIEEVSVELVKGVGIFPGPFPGGWCQDASRAIGHLLADKGETGFKLVFGCRPDGSSKTHVWLEREGLIVDLTADQFTESGCPAVMVTRDRTWHNGWDQIEQDLDELSQSNADGALYSAVSRDPAWNAGMTFLCAN